MGDKGSWAGAGKHEGRREGLVSEREEERHKPRGTRGWQVLKMFTKVWLEGLGEVFPHVCSPKTPGTPPRRSVSAPCSPA